LSPIICSKNSHRGSAFRLTEIPSVELGIHHENTTVRSSQLKECTTTQRERPHLIGHGVEICLPCCAFSLFHAHHLRSRCSRRFPGGRVQGRIAGVHTRTPPGIEGSCVLVIDMAALSDGSRGSLTTIQAPHAWATRVQHSSGS